MESIKHTYPNGTLTTPVETIDGVFEYVYVDFVKGLKDFPIEKIEFWNCNHPNEILRFFDALLNQKPEEVWVIFQQMVGAILLMGEAYTIYFGECSFSYDPYKISKKHQMHRINLTGVNTVTESEQSVISERDKYIRTHSFTYQDSEAQKAVTVMIMDDFFEIEGKNAEQLRAFPDKDYEEYVQKLMGLWKSIRRNGFSLMLKMELIHIGYRFE